MSNLVPEKVLIAVFINMSVVVWSHEMWGILISKTRSTQEF